MNRHLFSENTKPAGLILSNYRLLFVLPRFGISPAEGDETLGELCTRTGVSLPLLLAVCNLYTFDGYLPEKALLEQIPVDGLVAYLRRSHTDYLERRIPRITESILASAPAGHRSLLERFCEKYRREVVAHFDYEEQMVFPYIDALLEGKRPAGFRMETFEANHSHIEESLGDLKNLLVKYLAGSYASAEGQQTLVELFLLEDDLDRHNLLENSILVPLVERLERHPKKSYWEEAGLSEREKEILRYVALGLTNKEIADRLFISAHTVISHRKNITRKTGIKTVSGLTLYAAFNRLISLEDMQ